MTDEPMMSLSDLESQARAAIARKEAGKTQEKSVSEPVVEAESVVPTEGTLVPIEELPMVEMSKGGGHLKKTEGDDLSKKDLEILALLACGTEKTVTASLAGIDRRTIYKLLDSERVERLTKGAKKRLASLAPLAVEIIHAELVKGNVEVAQQVLKGLAIMKTSVNTNSGKEKVTSVAEEIIEDGGKTTKRVIRSRETND